MKNIINGYALHDRMRRVNAWFQALILLSAALLPLLMSGLASAAPSLTERELQSTTARPGQTTALTWIFDTTTDTANIDHIEIEFCDAPLGTCNTTNVPTIAASPTATLTNFTSGGNSASRTNGDNGGTNNQILIDKTTADAGASLDEATISLAATDITNNAVANRSYYTRMRIYSDTGTTLVWEGNFAQSTSQVLTVTARVQERLDFCVGATSTNNATSVPQNSTPANINTCADMNGSDVSLGSVETGFTNVTPVPVANIGGDNENGIAMVRTNAINGVVVDYKAIDDASNSGQLKIAGAGNVCSGTSTTDPCFNSVGTTNDEIDAGTEEFGMVVAGVNCGSTTSYTCTFGSNVYNLKRDDAYDGVVAGQDNTTYVADSGQVAGTTAASYAWDDSNAADRIASSTGSTVKVVDDEALILKFAATASSTTPTGSYQVQADFIATATF